MTNCAVFLCGNRSFRKRKRTSSDDGERNQTRKRQRVTNENDTLEKVRFFRVPTVDDRETKPVQELQRRRRHEWFARINRKDINQGASHYRVCGRHFVQGEPATLHDVNHPDWAPSVSLGYERRTSSGLEKYQRLKQRTEKKQEVDAAEALLRLQQAHTPASVAGTPDMSGTEVCELALVQENATNDEETESLPGCAVGTDLTMSDISNLQAENHKQNEEVYRLRSELSRHILDEDTFRANERMVTFYTGLPNFAILLAVFHFLEDSVAHGPCNSLTRFQEMIVTLMRFRLNSPLQDLAYRFSVSQPTISRILSRWTDAMYVRLKGLILWPSRECLQKTMPMAFRSAFGLKVAVILDCFEVFIDRPSSLVTRALTWSHYKHHNTVKYLIGICPQGVVTYVSKGWGGRTSDKEITESCGVLDNLLPGDSVLADRGFTIADSVGIHRAKLELPAFTRGKAQLSPWEVENTRRLANVRIHVERVIGLVRTKYSILKSTIPIEMVTTREGDEVPMLDKVVVVCCSLCNLCNSVVPFE
ncbi:uncharacterized protein LOC135392443 [Ornithodoros turicata]|uniref:uncharacterized protein LOC135392443 n=1 Tax=Ornithodoros turicata TaxID=34597 RepID=UPI003139413F